MDYNILMEKNIDELKGEKQSLLLHCCCAPCSTSVIERLMKNFDLTLFFYNPNIAPFEEYESRLNELKKLTKESIYENIKIIEEGYCKDEFENSIKGYEQVPEGGKRCETCYDLRLRKTAALAKKLGYNYFTTTLTVSPLKKALLINEIGKKCEKEYCVTFLPSDFKKKNGYLRSIELSQKYNLTRQDYCGCIYSKKEKNERI